MHPIGYGQVPDCCRKCKKIESDSSDEYSPIYYYCTLGMKMPTKKLTCKRTSTDGKLKHSEVQR